MEITKNRYGIERSYERIDFNRVRVMGDTMFTRTSNNDAGKISMYDFEGGPCLTIGGKIRMEGGLEWKIRGIKPIQNKHGLGECILKVTPIF
jgi:hypothetical protein